MEESKGNFMEVEEMKTFTGIVTPEVNSSVRKLCRQPYHNHKKGCPNYGTRATCPPHAPYITEVLDLDQPCFAVIVKFDFDAHVEKMRAKHHKWTEHQLRNVLYWQGTVRKELRKGIGKVLAEERPGLIALECPEACGVLVEETINPTLSLTGSEMWRFDLEWMPQKWDHHVGLIGTPTEKLQERYPEFWDAVQRGRRIR